MSLAESLRKVKPALASTDVVLEFKHFLLKDGFIYAQDGRITAAAPIELATEKEFLIPANEFEKTVNLFDSVGKNIDIKITDKNLLLSTDVHKARLKILDPSLFKVIDIDIADRYEAPKDFITALRIVRPFISENATQLWAAGAYIDGNKIYATNNVVLICADIIDFNFKGMLPLWAVEFILSRHEPLKYIKGNENALKVEWEDGSWMRSNLINAAFPQAGLDMLSQLTDAENILTPSWKQAYRQAAMFSENEIHLYSDKIYAMKDSIEFDVAAETPVGEELEKSTWNPKFLSSVVDIATAIDFGDYPKPATFSGKGFRGLVTGRR